MPDVSKTVNRDLTRMKPAQNAMVADISSYSCIHGGFGQADIEPR